MTFRVLLVDDHELMRDGLRSILEKEEDVEVVGEAADGRTAIALARTVNPDIVVMDVVMKDLNGIEATRQILAESPRVKVIALSSHADDRYVQAILEAGASAYVLKANAYDNLRSALDAVGSGKSYLSPEVTEAVIQASRGGGVELRDGSLCARLSPREKEVLQLLAEGLSSPQIGDRLFVATNTVETHRRNIMRKINLHSVADLTKYAVREGLTTLEP
jgi:two-component system NarL family response regulator